MTSNLNKYSLVKFALLNAQTLGSILGAGAGAVEGYNGAGDQEEVDEQGNPVKRPPTDNERLFRGVGHGALGLLAGKGVGHFADAYIDQKPAEGVELDKAAAQLGNDEAAYQQMLQSRLGARYQTPVYKPNNTNKQNFLNSRNQQSAALTADTAARSNANRSRFAQYQQGRLAASKQGINPASVVQMPAPQMDMITQSHEAQKQQGLPDTALESANLKPQALKPQRLSQDNFKGTGLPDTQVAQM